MRLILFITLLTTYLFSALNEPLDTATHKEAKEESSWFSSFFSDISIVTEDDEASAFKMDTKEEKSKVQKKEESGFDGVEIEDGKTQPLNKLMGNKPIDKNSEDNVLEDQSYSNLKITKEGDETVLIFEDEE